MTRDHQMDFAIAAATRPRPQPHRAVKHPPLDLTASAFLVTAKVGQRARASFQGNEVEGLLVRASSTHVTLRLDDGTLLTLLPRTHAFVWPV